METPMAAGLARRLDHRLGRDARRPPAGAVRPLCTGLLFARGRRTVASWLRGCPRDATTSAITTCSAASDARPRPSPGSCSASSLSGSRAMRRARRWSSPSTTRPPSGTGRTSRAPASITTPLPDQPGPRSSTATSGSLWPAWSDTRSGGRSPCRSSRTCTSEPKMSAGWRPTTAGSSDTKLELAAAQIEWLVQQLGPDHPPIWVVTDGAYAKRPFLKRVLAAGVTVISRLRCDAALWSLPPVVDPGQKRGRGRPPKYGKQRIDLAKRAGQTRGWQTGLFPLYGRLVVKKYKTFLATYKPVGGVIRVVLVREPDRLGGVLRDRPGFERGSRSCKRWPTARRWSKSSTTSRRSMEPVSSNCGMCGPTWGRGT